MNSDPQTSAATILLVEDDDELRREMATYLRANGYFVREAADVRSGYQALDDRLVRLLVLDLNLPGEDGLSLCRKLADRPDGPPILILSALGDPVDRIIGLELGADDYVVKPITPRELLARVKALLRRQKGSPEQGRRHTYDFAGFQLTLATRQLVAPTNVVLALTRSELVILQALLQRSRSVVTREELAALVLGEAPDAVGRGIDLHISRLRRKIEDQTGVSVIRTCRGSGYMIDVEVHAR